MEYKYSHSDIEDIVTNLWAKMKGCTHDNPSNKTLELIDNVNKKHEELLKKHDLLLEEIKGDYGIMNTLKEIKAQTIKTNGRVSGLENWKAYITGGIAVVMAVIIPCMLILFTNYVKIKEEVKSVSTVLYDKVN